MTEDMRLELAPGYSISRVINGCWQQTPDHGGGVSTEKEAMRLFDDLVDHGFTTFDCADIYTGVEALLGRYRAGLSDPDSIQIHTKLVPDKATLDTLTAEQVDAVINRSLRRLGVEQLDLVQFHWWDYQIAGLELLAERLMLASAQGKIRLLGVTNFNTEWVRRLVEMGVPLVSLQAQYSLLDRRPDRHMAAASEETGVGVLAYGVLAGGFLGSSHLNQAQPATVNRSLTKYRLIIEEAGGWSSFQQLLEILAGISKRHEVPMELVAARWVLEQPMVRGIILGTGRKSRARSNLRLFDFCLDQDDHGQINQWIRQHPTPQGDMYELERDEHGPHASIIKTNLQGIAS